jgi:predicted nucleic acid-binding Zn ribbon protein
MKCPKCGQDNQEDAKFCKNCGAALTPLVQVDGVKLSDQDKQRIAEDEKERLKVREQLKTEEADKKTAKRKKNTKFVLFGCGGVIVLIIIIIIVIVATSSGSKSTTNNQSITFTSDEYPPESTSIPNAFTASFSTLTQDWTIDWSYTTSQAIINANEGGFAIFVYPTTGPDTNDYIASVTEPSTTSGTLSCDVAPGQYQIEVVTLYSWNITVHP